MNVLSLFDGISCGQVALKKSGIKYKNYFSSEIDSDAIMVTQRNFPNTLQLGDVCSLKSQNLPKIDLLIGGSPCQGFSYCGHQLNFNDPRSKLFFEYVRLLKEIKPKYFLLENVSMKKEYENIISDHLGVKPIIINSLNLSCQSRKRLYWTNIKYTPFKCKNIVIADILESAEKPITNRYYTPKRVGVINGGGQGDRIYSIEGKAITLLSASGGTAGPGNMLIETYNGYRKLSQIEIERVQTLPDNYTSCLSLRKAGKCIGNGWTVDVISHIFSNLK